MMNLNKLSPKLVAEAKRILESFDNGLIKITINLNMKILEKMKIRWN